MVKDSFLPWTSQSGICIEGLPVYRVTGISAYIPREEAVGEGGMMFPSWGKDSWALQKRDIGNKITNIKPNMEKDDFMYYSLIRYNYFS